LPAPLIWNDPRRLLALALDDALARSEETGSPRPALLLVELDSYERLEHVGSRAEADRVMDWIQHRMAQTAGDDGLVVRFRLDSFAVLLAAAGPAQARLAAEDLHRAFRRLRSAPTPVRTALSIGIRAAEAGQAVGACGSLPRGVGEQQGRGRGGHRRSIATGSP
jgi:GGDEF domain-containing protein